MSRVTVSWISRVTRRTRNRRGAMGSTPGGPAAGRSPASSVDIQQLQPRGPKPLPDDLCEPFKQLVAEPRVGLALPADAGAIEGRGPGQFDGPRVTRHAVRRDQPRPPEQIPRPERLD